MKSSAAIKSFVGEATLIRRARGADRAALAALVEHYWQPVYCWLLRLSHSHQEAEDLTQETFQKALTGLASFRTGTSWKPWLFRIAYHSFLNRRRAERNGWVPLPADLSWPGPGPLEQLENRENLERVKDAMRRLPVPLRDALLLRTQDQLPFPDVAAALKTSVANARWRVCMARKRLMRYLNRSTPCGGPGGRAPTTVP
jgi:RNA polymerase sigma-70 factor, ECF subfamily